MPVEQGLPWHPVATGLAGQAIPFIVAASHAHALPSPPHTHRHTRSPAVAGPSWGASGHSRSDLRLRTASWRGCGGWELVGAGESQRPHAHPHTGPAVSPALASATAGVWGLFTHIIYAHAFLTSCALDAARLDRRLEEVAEAVGGGYCRL